MTEQSTPVRKKRRHSKTHLFNLALVVVATLDANSGFLEQALPSGWFPLAMILIAVVNTVLREVTSSKLEGF